MIIKSPKDGSYYDNKKELKIWNNKKAFACYKKSVNKKNWDGDAPQEIDAYYSPNYNEIVFTAAFLQPPYFNVLADDATNYGAIGTVIGHEISHAFDDQGSSYDSEGNLRNWWTNKDANHFKKLGNKLSDYYSQLEPFPGVFVDGKSTLGENIGDFGGVQVAFDALQIHLKNKSNSKINNFTPQQRFFISYAKIWRTIANENFIKYQIKTDFHSPDRYRGYIPIIHMDAWYEAFKINPEDSLYIEPKNRIKIW